MAATTTPRVVLRVALIVLARLREEAAEYDAYVARMHAAGYRAEYCRHGVNVWANDFDGACWQCEDGDTDPYATALSEAHRRVDDYLKRVEIFRQVKIAGMPINLEEVRDWLSAPLGEGL